MVGVRTKSQKHPRGKKRLRRTTARELPEMFVNVQTLSQKLAGCCKRMEPKIGQKVGEKKVPAMGGPATTKDPAGQPRKNEWWGEIGRNKARGTTALWSVRTRKENDEAAQKKGVRGGRANSGQKGKKGVGSA